MGEIVRPEIFARRALALTPAPRTPCRGVFDARALAAFVALAGLAWIVALAGAAFAARLTILICFAMLAPPPRRSRETLAVARKRV
jgi:hypothetical protein